MLLTMYAARVKRSELCRLRVSDIDSQRMMPRIERSKNRVYRDVAWTSKLLETLRALWQWMLPKTYLFPGRQNGCRSSPTGWFPELSRLSWKWRERSAVKITGRTHKEATETLQHTLEKVAILRRHLLEGMAVSTLCEEVGLQPTVFYCWQKEFFENGAAVPDFRRFQGSVVRWRTRLMSPSFQNAHLLARPGLV